jgi:hypothetical protein
MQTNSKTLPSTSNVRPTVLFGAGQSVKHSTSHQLHVEFESKQLNSYRCSQARGGGPLPAWHIAIDMHFAVGVVVTFWHHVQTPPCVSQPDSFVCSMQQPTSRSREDGHAESTATQRPETPEGWAHQLHSVDEHDEHITASSHEDEATRTSDRINNKVSFESVSAAGSHSLTALSLCSV